MELEWPQFPKRELKPFLPFTLHAQLLKDPTPFLALPIDYLPEEPLFPQI